MKQYNKLMQYFWLVVGILASIYAGFTVYNGEETDPLVFFMPALAFILFGMRRWYNSKLKKADSE